MKFKELPVGKIGVITTYGNVYGRVVVNVSGKYYIIGKGEKCFIPNNDVWDKMEIKMIGHYDEGID